MTFLIDKPLDELLTERSKLERRLSRVNASIESKQAKLLKRLPAGDGPTGWEDAFDAELQDARSQ